MKMYGKSRELIKDKIKSEIIDILSDAKDIMLRQLENKILQNKSNPQLFLIFTIAVKELEKEGCLEIIRNGHRAPIICHTCRVRLKNDNSITPRI